MSHKWIIKKCGFDDRVELYNDVFWVESLEAVSRHSIVFIYLKSKYQNTSRPQSVLYFMLYVYVWATLKRAN